MDDYYDFGYGDEYIYQPGDEDHSYTPTYDPDFESPYDNSGDSNGYTGGGSEENVFDPTSIYEITNTATTPGAAGYGWKYYSDGTSISPDGKYYHQGEMVYDVNNPDGGTLSKLLGKDVAKALKSKFVNPDGSPNLAGIGAIGMTLYGLTNKDKQGGYNKPVPKMDMVREQIQYNDPNRRPGESGRQYFTDPRFAAQGNAEALAAAKAASAEQASGLQAAMQAAPAPAPNPYAGKMKMAYNPQPVANTETTGAGLPQIPTQLTAQGGIPMAKGGLADAGRYLQGKTDGMADEIETSIDGEQPALLSHGEFVIPADVVSHLGNGNSEAGAEKLYAMMDRIREARTGTKEQGKEINADKFLAAASGGLMAAYAGGGQVQRFNGVTGSDVNATGGSGAVGAAGGAGIPNDVSRTSTLSPWVGDYVTNALGQGAALAAAPYQAYQGPLTAGASNLQQQAFAGGSEMAQAGYTPGKFTNTFTSDVAQQYMNPYLQASLDPQLKELQRQSDIARLGDAGRLTKAGAFGGSRQAIMESEGRRNLLDKQQDVLGTGYKTAYDMAQQQYAKDRGDEEASRQFGANFGMKSVDMLSGLGAIERGITSEGIAADKEQFEEQRDFAYGMPKYQLGLLSGLPIGANTTSVDQDALGRLNSTISGLGASYKTLDAALKALGVTPAPVG
jgi:hypothetical protein